MGYRMEISKLKWAADFVDRDIQRICAKIKEREELQKKLRQLREKREPLRKKQEEVELTRQMFAFGGEQVEAKDSSAREAKRLDAQIRACQEQIAALEKGSGSGEKAERFLKDAKLLEEQAERLWGLWRTDGRTLERESDKPEKFMPALEAWEGSSADLALQVKAMLLRLPFTGRTQKFDQEALAVFRKFQSRKEIREAPQGKEKSAFFSVEYHLLLKEAFRRAAAGEWEGLKRAARELEEAIQGRPQDIFVDFLSPALREYLDWIRRPEKEAGWPDSELVVFLGRCYHYLPSKDQGSFVKDWLFWMEEAMRGEAIQKRLQTVLKAGFQDFLEAYQGGGGKRLREVLGKWDGQACFEPYSCDFAGKTAAYVNRPELAEEAERVLKEKYPQIQAFASKEPHPRQRRHKDAAHFPKGQAPSAYEPPERQLAFVCLNGMPERNKDRSWLDLELDPAAWDPVWVERQIRDIVSWQLGEYVAEYTSRDGSVWVDAAILPKQLEYYFTEIEKNGVWDEQLDQGVRAVVEDAGSLKHIWLGGKDTDSPTLDGQIRMALEKFEGKEAFAPYEGLLKPQWLRQKELELKRELEKEIGMKAGAEKKEEPRKSHGFFGMFKKGRKPS